MPGLRVAVAVSGGRDSTALLHCTLRSAADLGVQVLALHVHHGIQADADGWLDHVRRQSRRWGAAFDCRRLAGAPEPGASVEAWARRERYRALAQMAHGAGCEIVLLAHHRRDQAETWLLQALRGGGAAGLSAMPRMIRRAGLLWARPWLNLPPTAIDAYVKRHRLSHIEDGSNADLRYDRNRLRSKVWPALVRAFPGAEAALTEAAAQAQGAAALAAEAVAADLAPLLQGQALAIAPWLTLPPARRHNVLKGWLAQALGRGAPDALLTRLAAELPRSASARWSAPSVELRLYRGLLEAVAPTPAASGAQGSLRLDLDRPGSTAVPDWQGRFVVEATTFDGAPAALLHSLELRPRQGGERFRLTPRATPRSLKKQYQSLAIPAWDRQGPLLFTADGRLIFVPGLGIEGSTQADPGKPQLRISWHPDGPGPTGGRQTAS